MKKNDSQDAPAVGHSAVCPHGKQGRRSGIDAWGSFGGPGTLELGKDVEFFGC